MGEGLGRKLDLQAGILMKIENHIYLGEMIHVGRFFEIDVWVGSKGILWYWRKTKKRQERERPSVKWDSRPVRFHSQALRSIKIIISYWVQRDK